MIVEPTNVYEDFAVELMTFVMTNDLFTVDCGKVVDPVKGDGCAFQVRWSSGAVEQISALIGEWLEAEYVEEADED